MKRVQLFQLFLILSSIAALAQNVVPPPILPWSGMPGAFRVQLGPVGHTLAAGFGSIPAGAPKSDLFLQIPTYATPGFSPKESAPAAVAIADFNHDGIPDLAVTSSDDLVGNVSILLGNGDGTFQPHVDYRIHNSSAGSIAVGDFNGDGNLDLAVDACYDCRNTVVSILLGNGDGTFAPAKTFPAPNASTSVQVADFNGDGKLDLAMSEIASSPICGVGYNSLVSVMLGNGDGTFQTATTFPTGTECTWSVQVADLNGDGKPDLVTANGYPNVGSGSISVLIGKGDGTFEPAVVYTSGGTVSYSVAVGDLNGDGKRDIVLTNGFGTEFGLDYFGSVSVFLGNGDGTFQPYQDFPVQFPSDVVLGDFNNDGKLDVLTEGYAGNNVLLGNGDGTLQPPVNYVGSGSIAASDLNRDGSLDIVFLNSDTTSLSVLLGNGDGTFPASQNYPAGYELQSAALGDFNGDGKPDLVVADEYDGSNGQGLVNVLLGNGDGSFQAPISATADNEPIAVVAGDFNHDGKLDAAALNSVSDDLSILIGNGDGTFQPAVNYPLGSSGYTMIAADFNNDGNLDLAIGYSGIGDIGILLGNGDGTFQASVNYAVPGEATSIVAADLNHDGKLDLVASEGYSSVTVLLGNGDGTFQPYVSYPTGSYGSSSVAVGDFNGDGKPDIAVSSLFLKGGFGTAKEGVSVLLGRGDGTFDSPLKTLSQLDSSLGRGLAVGDFNGDGKMDLVASGGYYTGRLVVYLGNGKGLFPEQLILRAGFYPQDFIVTDINGDGTPDILAIDYIDCVSVLLNQRGLFSAAKEPAHLAGAR
jgi:hypothetical protein